MRRRIRAASPGNPVSSNTVSTIDVQTRRKNPNDIPVGQAPFGVAVTPDGKTAFVTNRDSGTVSAIDVKTRTKHPTDIHFGAFPFCRRQNAIGEIVLVGERHESFGRAKDSGYPVMGPFADSGVPDISRVVRAFDAEKTFHPN